MSEREPTDRPAASGHRFGPDLTCSECGISWDAHQREPAPCDLEEIEEEFESPADRLGSLTPLGTPTPRDDR